ncbi:hypothetical protein TRAPUB_4721 [Trametes pubescens]|uniref:DH domain-containing protein n=1 Tax=Trametes pubescens TaxID=154538 RepID=A0A1M2V9Y1_TRAPU|nr:hypothetical protein TRAPUB_4721 [Trametes pubescens]
MEYQRKRTDVHASIPADIFNPYALPRAAYAPWGGLVNGHYPSFASSTSSLRPTRDEKLLPEAPPRRSDAVRADPRSSQKPAPRSSRHAAPVALVVDGNASHFDGDARTDDYLSPAAAEVDEDTPPPVPPKSPLRFDRTKSVSIQMPTDISPAGRTFSHSQSDVGHSYRTTVNGTATSPEGEPGARAILTSPHVSTPAGLDSSSSPKAPHARTSMEPATRKASSVRVRRNKLHKSRQHSLPPSSFRPSLFGSLLARAFGSHDASCASSRSSSSPSMSDRPYRPSRSVSDSGHSATKRPLPSSRSSDTTDSSCTTDSSGSTAFSYASTALTTPDASPPSLSPRNSTRGVRANKLHKRRPPPAPSGVYQYPLGGHATALGRSQSTPDDLGQRAPTRRNWSSVEDARYGAQEADSLEYGPDPTSWYTSMTDLSSPSRESRRASTLDPIFEVRSKRSTHALAQLACTGLCSTSVAALSSQLALQDDLSDRLSTLNVREWDDPIVEDPFNPYVECASPTEYVSGGPPSPSAESSTSGPSPPQRVARGNAEGTGFSVVSGSLDRSEDAMRRWTLAMADVPDEVLVHHLERLRKESQALARGRLPGRRSAAPSQVGHGDENSTLDTSDRRSSFFFGGPREMGISTRSPSRARFSVGNFERELDGDISDDDALSDGDNEEDWNTARQMLFRCRELVQTERNYQARLRELAATDLSSHYAWLVVRHLPALIKVSETLLAHLFDDPSAWGVSTAFIGCEEELEAALVAWSAVVGDFFAEDANLKPTRKLTKKFADDSLSNHGHDSPAPSLRLAMRTRSQNGISTPKRESFASGRLFSTTTMSDVGHGEASPSVGHGSGMFTAALGTGLAFGLSVPQMPPPFEPDYSPVRPTQARSAHGHGQKANASALGLSRAMSAMTAVSSWKRKSMPSSLGHLPSLVNPPASPVSPHTPTHGYGSHAHAHHHHSSSASAHGHGKKHSEQDAKMHIRELAIQPTQRVMRYVLQYRDLLDHTPTTSPSRALVERAYEIALRIAKRCDRAQAHAAFVRQQHQK